jgi:hypothetical protein
MCGYSDYQNLEASDDSNVSYNPHKNAEVAVVVDDQKSGDGKQSNQAKGQPKPAAAHSKTADTAPTAAQSAGMTFLTPRDEEDIVCGIDLDVAKSEFQFNGVKHPAGTLRIVRLHKDGVCEVRTHHIHTCIASYMHCIIIHVWTSCMTACCQILYKWIQEYDVCLMCACVRVTLIMLLFSTFSLHTS